MSGNFTQVFRLLLEFANVFPEGLSGPDLVRDKIDTGAAPIRQQPQRLPFAKWGKLRMR